MSSQCGEQLGVMSRDARQMVGIINSNWPAQQPGELPNRQLQRPQVGRAGTAHGADADAPQADADPWSLDTA